MDNRLFSSLFAQNENSKDERKAINNQTTTATEATILNDKTIQKIMINKEKTETDKMDHKQKVDNDDYQSQIKRIENLKDNLNIIQTPFIKLNQAATNSNDKTNSNEFILKVIKELKDENSKIKEENKLRDQRLTNVEQGVQTINESLDKIPDHFLNS